MKQLIITFFLISHIFGNASDIDSARRAVNDQFSKNVQKKMYEAALRNDDDAALYVHSSPELYKKFRSDFFAEISIRDQCYNEDCKFAHKKWAESFLKNGNCRDAKCKKYETTFLRLKKPDTDYIFEIVSPDDQSGYLVKVDKRICDDMGGESEIRKRYHVLSADCRAQGR